MALISTKNIISPFTNKLHLTSIILLVIAFTIFRLSGGKVELVKEGVTPSFMPEASSNFRKPVEKPSSKNNSLKELEEMFR